MELWGLWRSNWNETNLPTSRGNHHPVPSFLESPRLFKIFILIVTRSRSWQFGDLLFQLDCVKYPQFTTVSGLLAFVRTGLSPFATDPLNPRSPLYLILSIKCSHHSCTDQNQVHLFPWLSGVTESHVFPWLFLLSPVHLWATEPNLSEGHCADLLISCQPSLLFCNLYWVILCVHLWPRAPGMLPSDFKRY